MRGEDVRDLIEVAVGSAHASTNGWYRGTCPICVVNKGSQDKKQSLGFRPDSGFFYCMRCGVRGFIRGDFHLMADRVATGLAESEKPPEDLDPPEGYMPLHEEPAYSAYVTEAAREYLIRRNIPERTWREAQLGITFTGPHAHRIIIPIVSAATQQWVGWAARTWMKPEEGVLSYRYPMGMKRGQMLWNADVLFDESDDPAIVVEGTFDGLPHWPYATACLGKPSRGQYPILLAARRPLVIALDGDAWMEAEALSMKLRFHGKRAGYLRLPPCTDPGDLKPGELLDLAKGALCR